MDGKKKEQIVLRTMQKIQERCYPLLVGYSGSIAYGTNLPGSDIDIRGIFLNPPEEWIGLQEDSEQIRLDDSDTVVYSLKKAMKREVAGVLDTLNEKEANVLRMRYGLNGAKPMSLKEVGDACSLTKERIRQIEKNAIERVRVPASMRSLQAYVAA